MTYRIRQAVRALRGEPFVIGAIVTDEITESANPGSKGILTFRSLR
jgi:hypothetical protein